MDFWWYDTNRKMVSTAYGSAGIALGAAATSILRYFPPGTLL